MAPERVDELRALPDKTLVGAERHSTALSFGTLHRHEPHGRAHGCLCICLRIRAVILLALDERLHIRRRHQTHFVDRETAPHGPSDATWRRPP